MNQLYNEEIKEKFLNNYDNQDTQKTIRNVFFKTELVEKVLDKDIYNFNLTEINKAIVNTVPHSKSVARSTGRFISQYISWAIDNGYRESNINPLKGVTEEFYDNTIDKSKKIHYSYDEFLELLEHPEMHNNQDKAFLFLIWEGLMGQKFSEIRTLHWSDIDETNNTIYIKERDDKITVSAECIKYVRKAYEEKTYYSYVQNKGFNERELLESHGYIFKNIRSPRSQEEGQQIGMNVLYNRIHAIKEILQLDYLTPNGIRQSGIIKMAVDLYKQYGVLGYDQFAIIGKQYNWSVLENNGYQYYNSYLLREFVTSENISDLYGIDNVEFKLR